MFANLIIVCTRIFQKDNNSLNNDLKSTQNSYKDINQSNSELIEHLMNENERFLGYEDI